MPLHLDVEINLQVLGFTLLLALITTILFALLPALEGSRLDLVSLVQSRLRTGSRPRLRRWLVAGQIALTLVLLVGSGLLLRSLQAVNNLDLGFQPEEVVVGSINLRAQGQDADSARVFREHLKKSLESRPGVSHVSIGARLPLQMNPRQSPVLPEGWADPAGAGPPSVDFNVVDQDYFETLQIPILQGRSFQLSDSQQSQPVAIVNRRFAELFWPDDPPIGKEVVIGGRQHEVVGLVATGKYFSLGEAPKPYFYLPLTQQPLWEVVLHARGALPASQLTRLIRQQVRELDATLPVAELGPMREALGFVFLPARLAAIVVTAFGLLAQLLAAVGLYGLMALWVTQNQRPIAIRMALGASPGGVLQLVLAQASTPVIGGLLFGLLGALALSQWLAGLLYGSGATDPAAFVLAALTLGAVCVVAALAPTQRIARTQPATLLRSG